MRQVTGGADTIHSTEEWDEARKTRASVHTLVSGCCEPCTQKHLT